MTANLAEFKTPRKVSLTRRFTFEASHQLVGYPGPCANMHGHSYKLEVKVSGFIDAHPDRTLPNSMVMDFGCLKEVVERVIDPLDHSHLNDLFGCFPTAEIMVVRIYERISELLPTAITLESVKLWETEKCWAEYNGGK